jgi:hypothetical protein
MVAQQQSGFHPNHYCDDIHVPFPNYTKGAGIPPPAVSSNLVVWWRLLMLLLSGLVVVVAEEVEEDCGGTPSP